MHVLYFKIGSSYSINRGRAKRVKRTPFFCGDLAICKKKLAECNQEIIEKNEELIGKIEEMIELLKKMEAACDSLEFNELCQPKTRMKMDSILKVRNFTLP